jgi:hypothetical protein
VDEMDGHIIRKREKRNAYKIMVGRPKDYSEDLGVDGRTVLD